MNYEYDEHGRPILNLSEKLNGLRYCIEDGSTEDAVGHIFDLLSIVAPGYKLEFDNGNGNQKVEFPDANSLAEYYGTPPTPVTFLPEDVVEDNASVIVHNMLQLETGKVLKNLPATVQTELLEAIRTDIQDIVASTECPVELQVRDLPHLDDK